MAPGAAPDSEDAEESAEAVLDASSVPASEPPRKLFPETWIWSDLIAGFVFVKF